MPTRILAIDTATEACSAALWNEGEITTCFAITPNQHTQHILPFIQKLLADAEIGLSDLDALAYSQGPGSFTGVRIGVGIAQGLAFGANLPMIGLSTLNILAQGAYRLTQQPQIIAAIDARMGELYWGEYCIQKDQTTVENTQEKLLSAQDAKLHLDLLSGNWVCCGSGFVSYADLINPSASSLTPSDHILPEAQDMLPLALADWQAKRFVNAEAAQPVYLRNEVAWKKLPGR